MIITNLLLPSLFTKICTICMALHLYIGRSGKMITKSSAWQCGGPHPAYGACPHVGHRGTGSWYLCEGFKSISGWFCEWIFCFWGKVKNGIWGVSSTQGEGEEGQGARPSVLRDVFKRKYPGFWSTKNTWEQQEHFNVNLPPINDHPPKHRCKYVFHRFFVKRFWIGGAAEATHRSTLLP